MAFLVKGEAETDSVAVIRSPKDTRQICMRHTFNKLIVDANCNSLNSEFSQITHHTQNGFTGGRNFLKNPVDIDASGRIYSCAYEGRQTQDAQNERVGRSHCLGAARNNVTSKGPGINTFNLSNIPISGAFDFEAALPSVIHLWIWVVLHHRKKLGHFINLFKAIYKHAKANLSIMELHTL